MKETACFELGVYLSEGANGAFSLVPLAFL